MAAVVALAVCLAGPAAYSVATAMTPHRGVIPNAGPSGTGEFGLGRFFEPADPSPAMVAALRADAARYTWTAAAIGSVNAAGYQLASATPVMAIGGFNGTDPAPTLVQFQQLVADRRIHYFVDTPMRGPIHPKAGSNRQAADITAWVTSHFTARTIGGVTVYELS
ncbi:MAG: hypothetical protein JO191_07315 [Mycobacteriaceae bacterium]|nr:hypothetical protein [Mycobacteriaceae bacterium]